MDEKQESDQMTYLYNKLVSELLVLKESRPPFSCVCCLCPDLLLKLSHVVNQIKDSFSDLSIDTDNAEVLSLLTVVKIFLEIGLRMPVDFVLREKAFEGTCGLYHLLILTPGSPLTLRFLSSEVLAHLMFVSTKLKSSGGMNNYFKDFAKLLMNEPTNLMFLLYTIDHLCILGKDFDCTDFGEFLAGSDGILTQQYFIRNLASSDVQVKILMLRIYTKTLSVIHPEKSRKVIFENIERMLIFPHRSNCHIAEKLFWKFLSSLLSFPDEEVNEKALIINAASTILKGFEAGLDSIETTKVCVNDDDDYNVIFVMGINVAMKSLLWLSKDYAKYSTLFGQIISKFPAICVSLQRQPPVDTSELISCLLEEDEDLVDILLLHLELHCVFLKVSLFVTEGLLSISPWELFLELLSNLAFDFSIFTDWLVSNETRFLRYFVRFLKLTRLYWSKFVETCASKDLLSKFDPALRSDHTAKMLDACVSTFIKLRNSISKLHKSGLFPYSPEPLLKHLDAIEDLFEVSNANCDNSH